MSEPTQHAVILNRLMRRSAYYASAKEELSAAEAAIVQEEGKKREAIECVVEILKALREVRDYWQPATLRDMEKIEAAIRKGEEIAPPIKIGDT